MGWTLRTEQDQNNPTLPDGVYYLFITIGTPFYWKVAGSDIAGIIAISGGGKYGLDKVTSFEYKGTPLTEGTEWIFHRGTFSSQIAPIQVTLSGSTFTNTGTNPFADGDEVRGRSIDGNLPVPLEEGILGQSKKYFIINRTATTFQLSLTSGGSAITMTDSGSGQLIFWKANKGFDDIGGQGLSTFAPETENTFNNIAWIEFQHNFGSTTEPPDWEDFRIFGVGRRLRDFDADGSEGIILHDDDMLGNPALIIADNYLWNHKGAPERIDWASLYTMRQASEVDILYRVNTSDTAITTGFTGRYFQGDDFTNQITSRQDATINIPDSLPTVNPATGVDGHGFSIIWKAQISPRYSELYTLKFDIDDEVECFVEGGSILHATSVGVHTATYSFIADQTYDIEIRFRQIYNAGIGNHYKCIFKWSSASQTEEVVPAARVFPSDEVVKRYRVSLAFNQATEASEIHELVMERVVGWDWTDDDGLIKFLPPDRPTVYAFAFDKMDDDSFANFTNQSFTRKRRLLIERENFKLGRYRKSTLDLYPYRFVQADRENLRRFTNGEPSNSPYIDIGVMTESQAQRFLEMQMVIKTDPDHLAEISGGIESSKLRKCQWITVFYVDDAGEVINQKYMITFIAWGDSASRQDFSLLPIPTDPSGFYSDEPIET